ncbi:MAG: ATP-binding cassette domain-containing protein [Alphaproteobacteria bacterium]|nr:MAG: ATP-binding cassette domain-containing protein [Alphaproteobacteria bacterium]
MNKETANKRSSKVEENPQKIVGSAKSLKVIYSFLFPYKGLITAALVALVVAAGAQLAIFYSFRFIVDNGFSVKDPVAIDTYFKTLLLIGFIWGTAIFFRFKFVTTLGERVVADIRKKVHGHLVEMSPVFFEINRPGEISSRLTADTTVIQSIVGSSASIALRSLFTAIGGVALLLILSPKLAGLLLLVIPVLAFAMMFFGKQVRLRTRLGQDKLAVIGAMAGEAFSSIQVVQAFTQEDQEKKRFSNAVEETFQVAKKRISSRSAMMGLVTILFFSAVVFVLWIGAMDVLKGTMTWGDLTAFVGISIMVVASVGALSSVYGDVQKMIGAAGRLNELLTVTSALKVVAHPIAPANPVKGGIALKNITFYYPSKPNINALHDFTLTIAPGETVALVGPSGAGKTTFFQLLLRFFDPQEGTIKVDGVDISKMDPKVLRTLITIVPQETVLFAETILENVRYGRPEASQKEVWQALKDAHAEDFVKALPKGLKTYIGERGVRLSGGQRQRISIARAILRGAPIFLLDEATSSLDSASERHVQLALNKLMKTHTTVVIAHRLSTVRAADKIIVLDEGRIVDQGKHHDLIKKKGLYAHLAELQFNS